MAFNGAVAASVSHQMLLKKKMGVSQGRYKEEEQIVGTLKAMGSSVTAYLPKEMKHSPTRVSSRRATPPNCSKGHLKGKKGEKNRNKEKDRAEGERERETK